MDDAFNGIDEKILKSIVSDGKVAKFSHAEAGVLYYVVRVDEYSYYMFQVDMNDKDDVGSATFNAEIKAITLMRYIRKGMKNGTLGYGRGCPGAQGYSGYSGVKGESGHPDPPGVPGKAHIDNHTGIAYDESGNAVGRACDCSGYSGYSGPAGLTDRSCPRPQKGGSGYEGYNLSKDAPSICYGPDCVGRAGERCVVGRLNFMIQSGRLRFGFNGDIKKWVLDSWSCSSESPGRIDCVCGYVEEDGVKHHKNVQI
jgi:hypothetical protein